MKRLLEIRPVARKEFDEAADWYRDEDPLVRDRFVLAVEKTIADLTRTPLAFPVVFGSVVRRATVKRFPFSIHFIVEDCVIVIISIFHEKRNPMIWRGRID